MGSLKVMWQLIQKKENSEFKPIKLCSKIEFVSHPACAEELYIRVVKKLLRLTAEHFLWQHTTTSNKTRKINLDVCFNFSASAKVRGI